MLLNSVHKKVGFYSIVFVILLGVLFFIFLKMGFIFNLTPSYPIGLYKKLVIQDDIIEKNRLVSFCPSESVAIEKYKKSGYWLRSSRCNGFMPLIKMVRGVKGDKIIVTLNGVKINGSYLEKSRIAAPSFEFNQLPYFKTLSDNEYWLMSDYSEYSFDSRYFGSVKRKNIDSYVYPVITF